MPLSSSTTEAISSQSDRHSLFLKILCLSLRHFGPLHWWPGDNPFEIAIGAILTQNTAWTNVEKAIANMKDHGLMSPDALLNCDLEELALAVKPSGYFNMKAKRLKNFAHFLKENKGIHGLSMIGTDELRAMLLSVNGIGPETADDMLLYGFDRPIFVVDAYTRRILFRHGLIEEGADYDDIQAIFHRSIPPRAGIYNEFHAQIVYIGKTYCKRKNPRCSRCPLFPLFPVKT